MLAFALQHDLATWPFSHAAVQIVSVLR